ncbi:MAG: hypothetical protein IK057_00815 [Clostridia bacterium]|nr:hypothetical protein [Clostridia bacterium]
MKFSIGYQLTSTTDFLQTIISNKDSIYEVYFAWDGFANGRNTTYIARDFSEWDAQKRKMSDIRTLSENGIKLNLLFNATCYGAESLSKSFFESIGNTTDFVQSSFGLSSITTTSPLIAKFIKDNFPDIDVRASVNMSIGTIDGMEYIEPYFDSFYMARELNRDFTAIKRLKKWCDDNGKGLFALANSGCLNNCSAHIFHDNLVSHENDIRKMDNGYVFRGICKEYLSNPKHIESIFDVTNFIRPEDVNLYEGLFPALKLATRVSNNPIKILKAYIENQKFSGSVFDLLEPNHTNTIYPYLLDNSKIKKTVTNERLEYSGLESALIRLEE